ncbi:WD40/YVTN/BNR-like repeat-containing protein, partial [Dokdonella sp.]|uniref:WD40/YVTN/BNR-like repeat-containing protein n=1 Tax=Dokdonella sp. TaxID=2291710 RepID=UPI003C540EFD
MPTVAGQVNVPPDNEVTGAVQSIAPSPVDADIVYIGAVNGGIWKTSNATEAQPTWIPQSEELPSQSIGAIEFDLSDATHQTLVAGTGRWSNFARRGDDEIGVYRTTNGGDSWAQLGETALLGRRISAVSARGAVLMAATTNGGLYRSVDTGVNWTLVSGGAGLPSGNVLDLAADPGNLQRFYVSVDNNSPSILRSDDGGANWIDVSAGVSTLASTTDNMRISVGAQGVVYLVVVNSGRVAGVYRSSDLGANWTAMDTPSVHPGGQGSSNTAIVASPTDPDLVYVSGDRISFSPYTANIVRGDFSAATGSQFVIAMDAGAGGTSPHADSRDMEFDVNGNLLESDDGGIYRRSLPASSSGTWSSMIGNLNVMEVHDLAYDGIADVIMIGTQDNGTHIQRTS